MGKDIDVSVIIPVYNTDQTLFLRCLSSFCETTYFRYEILVIDDCSDERYETESICRKFDNVKYIRKEKNSGGASLTRNTGIDQAVGAFIMFVDSDDEVDLTACDRLFKQEKDNLLSYDAVCFGYKVMQDGKELGKTGQTYFITDKIMNVDAGSELTTKKQGYNCGVVWAKLYNRKTIGELRFEGDIRYGEDLCFNLKFDLVCKSVLCVNEYLYHYHLNDESIGHRLNRNVGIDFNKTINAVLGIYDRHGFSEEIYQRYYWTVLFDYFLIYCYSIYPYHKDAGLTRKQRKQELKRIMHLDGFQRALSEIDGKYFGFFHKVAIFLMKKNCLNLAHRCVQLKRKLK